MKEGPDIASVAALIGDPARANMLAALMSGMALTAGELAREAGVTPQTASAHLARLSDAALVIIEVQGRHRYVRLNGPDVAEVLESLMDLAARMGRLRTRPGPRDETLRKARVCYDHLAGAAGVRLFQSFVDREILVTTHDGLGLSAQGRARLVAEGLDIDALEAKPRVLCRTCLDWSERRHHLSGSLGAALLQMVLKRRWARREGSGRALVFGGAGAAQFEVFLRARDGKTSLERVIGR
jgi:DNA-binding transcriptional ArsR family regulator